MIREAITKNVALNRWIEEAVALCRPDRVHLCDGSDLEYHRIAQELVLKGTLVPLNPTKRPHSFWCHSHPDDVARVEENTFICSKNREDSGPTNHWKEPEEMRALLKKLFTGCMQGRTMYIIPYCMGPFYDTRSSLGNLEDHQSSPSSMNHSSAILMQYGSRHDSSNLSHSEALQNSPNLTARRMDSPFSHIGIEITDSAYVVLNMKIMTRMGNCALDMLGEKGSFVPGLHSMGAPLKPGESDTQWPCNPANRWIVHFPETREIWSFGSGYGGNSLLGKKCFALRIASAMGRDHGWLAEHMLILGITNPRGEKKYFAAAFPSACGKTNLAMMLPSLPGWKIECVGDDIAWLRFGSDGRLYAVNPEFGYFGVAPGTSMKTNPNAMRAISHDTLFTNVALTAGKDVWWEGIDGEAPAGLTSWLGELYDPKSGKPAAHPNSRFTVSAKQNPLYDPEAENPEGVPISAILFGGRRDSVVPLVAESLSWAHGVFMGASLSSEMTAAAKGVVGKLRHDPFAMLPFCGYNMGDYFAHWLEMGRHTTPDKLPKIYSVNWFRKEEGRFIWPGFGENSRVLKWIFERTSHNGGSQNGIKTAIGVIPKTLDWTGLNLSPETQNSLFRIDSEEWRKEAQELEQYFTLFGEKFPQELRRELEQLKHRLLCPSKRMI